MSLFTNALRRLGEPVTADVQGTIHDGFRNAIRNTGITEVSEPEDLDLEGFDDDLEEGEGANLGTDGNTSVFGETLNVTQVIQAFLNAFSSPSDQQLHAFANLLGMDYTEFEQMTFDLFRELVEDADEDDLEEVVEDPLDVFILSWFLYKDLNQENVYALADFLDVEPSEFEEHIYRMLSDLSQGTPEDDELDEIQEENERRNEEEFDLTVNPGSPPSHNLM